MRGLPVGLPPEPARPPGRARGVVFFLITFVTVFLAAMQLLRLLGL